MSSIYKNTNHYIYPVLDVECLCALCVEWRSQRDVFDELKMLTLTHGRSCMCWRCRGRRRAQNGFLAAAAKRELYCEMSWHASRHPSYGAKLMNWVDREIRETPETDGWWATLAQAYSLSYWMSRFQTAVFPETREALTAKVVPRPSAWCGWCGDTLSKGVVSFCSDTCQQSYQSDFPAVNGHGSAINGASGVAVFQRTRIRTKLSDLLSNAVSGTASWSVSGAVA